MILKASLAEIYYEIGAVLMKIISLLRVVDNEQLDKDIDIDIDIDIEYCTSAEYFKHN